MRIWLMCVSIVRYYDWSRAQMERNVNLEDWNAATSQTQVWDGARMKNTMIGIFNCWLNFSKVKWMNECCPGSSLYIFTLANCSSAWQAQTFFTFKTIVDPCWDYSGTIVRVWFCVLCRGLLAGAGCLCFAPCLGKLKITSRNLAALCPACIISSLGPRPGQPRTISPSSKSAHTQAEQRSSCSHGSATLIQLNI